MRLGGGSQKGARWTSAALFCQKTFFVNVWSLWSFQQISALKVTANPLCQELNVPWMLWDCLDILSEMHEDALSVPNTCFFPSIFSLLFFLLLVEIRISSCFMLTESLFPYLHPSSFQLPFVRKKEKDDFFLSTSLLCCQSLPSSAECPLALSCLNCCSLSQDVSEIKFSGARSVSFVSSLFAWEGATDIYGTAVVVMVTVEEWQCLRLSLAETFLFFFFFFFLYTSDETVWARRENWRSFKERNQKTFLPNMIWFCWQDITGRMLECKIYVNNTKINDTYIHWIGIWTQIKSNVFIGVLGARGRVGKWRKVTGLWYSLLGMLIAQALLFLYGLHYWRGSWDAAHIAWKEIGSLVYRVFSAAVP